jgi:NodT family efflux transporter outer membrane factor (OMF) lipoprotein
MRGGSQRHTARSSRAKFLFGVHVGNCLAERPLLAIFLALFSIVLGGCTPWRVYKNNGYLVGPNYCRPNADISDHWIDADDQRLSSEEPDLTHWWTAFDDPKLDSLIQTAVQQNLTLRAAGFRILESRANLAIQMGSLFPQTQQAFGTYSRNAISTLAANQQLLPNRFFSNWDLGFNLSWELDFWGRFRRAIESSAAELDASVFDYDDVLVTLLGDIGSTYYEIRTLQQEIAYVRQNVVIQNQSLTIATARFKGGLTSQLDQEQAISQLAQTEALIPQFEKRLRQASDRLCTLLGIPTVDLIPKLGDEPIPNLKPDVVVGIPCDLLTRRPDVRRAERQAAAQSAQIGIAEANLYPAISVTGTVGFDAARFTNLFKDHSFQSSIGPGFQWNVLNYGRLINNVRLQDAKFCELVTTYRNTVIRANADAEDGIVEFLQSQLQARALQRSVDAATRAVKIASAQYEGGEVDFNRVALLEQNLVQQQDLLAQAQGDIAIGLVHTYRALGGGWEVDCDSKQGIPTGSQIAEGAPAKSELVPPGKPSSGPNATPASPAPSAPGKFQLPGPAGTISNQPDEQPAHPATVAPLSGSAADKPMTLRFADDRYCIIDRRESPTEPANHPEILDHAAVLSSDRGEARWRR